MNSALFWDEWDRWVVPKRRYGITTLRSAISQRSADVMFPHPLRQINFKYRRVGLCVPPEHPHYVTVYMASYPKEWKR